MLKNTINNNHFNINDFIQKGNRCKRILHINEFIPNENNLVTLSYRDKLTKHDMNKQMLYQSLLEENTTTLVIAPTGSGKTFAIDEISQKLYKKSKQKELCILLCPNKIQNLQNEMSYHMACLIKGSKKLHEYNLKDNEITFSAVYDKIKTILEHMDYIKEENIKVHLIIDEAHLLIEQNNFRKDCIHNLFEAMRLVKQNHGNVMLLTATPESLYPIEFDKIINFTCEQNITTKAKRIVINRNKSNLKMEPFTYQLLKEEKKPTLVRYNSIQTIEKLKNDLLYRNQKQVLTLDGKQKQFKKIGNKITCKNSLFYNIINEENLPTSYKGNPVNTYLTTSVLEVGTNIKSIGNKQDPSLTPIFVIQDKNQMSLNSLIQFFNRIRYDVNEYQIYMPYIQENKNIPFQSLENILIDEKEKVLTYVKSFQKTIEAIEVREKNPILILQEINRILQLKNSKEESNHLGCIYALLDGRTIVIDYDIHGFFQTCYNKYIQQYFFKQEHYINRLKELFGVDVIVNDLEFEDDSIDGDEDLTKEFQHILNETSLQQEIIQAKITSPELLQIQQSHSFQQCLALFDLKNMVSHNQNKNIKEAVSFFATVTSQKKLKLEKRKSLITLFQCFNKRTYSYFIKFINHKLNTDEIEASLAHQFHLIKEDSLFFRLLSEAINLNISYREISRLLELNVNLKPFKQKIKQIQFKLGNDSYLMDESFLSGKSGFEQKVILDSLYIKNDANHLIQKTINQDLLKQLQLQLRESIGSNYTFTKIKQLIHLCFHLVTVNHQKRIISLK